MSNASSVARAVREVADRLDPRREVIIGISRDGAEMFNFEAKGDSFKIPRQGSMAKYRGMTLVHSHLNPLSHSKQDIISGMGLGMARTIVVTPDGIVHTVSFPQQIPPDVQAEIRRVLNGLPQSDPQYEDTLAKKFPQWIKSSNRKIMIKPQAATRPGVAVMKHGNHDQSTHGRKKGPRLTKDVKKNKGFTYRPASMSAPRQGYALSIFPQAELAVDEDEFLANGPAIINGYLEQWADVLNSNSDIHVGGWWDEEADRVYIDLSVITDDQQEAEELARQHGQEGIYDLGAGETIIVKPREERRGIAKQAGALGVRPGRLGARHLQRADAATGGNEEEVLKGYQQFDEAKIKRYPKGHPKAGQFRDKPDSPRPALNMPAMGGELPPEMAAGLSALSSKAPRGARPAVTPEPEPVSQFVTVVERPAPQPEAKPESDMRGYSDEFIRDYKGRKVKRGEHPAVAITRETSESFRDIFPEERITLLIDKAIEHFSPALTEQDVVARRQAAIDDYVTESKGAADTNAIATRQMPSPVPSLQTQEATLEATTEYLRYLPQRPNPRTHEQAFLINEDGWVMSFMRGASSQVAVNVGAIGQDTRGWVGNHNHPVDAGLSEPDIVSAAAMGLKSLTATYRIGKATVTYSDNFIYSLTDKERKKALEHATELGGHVFRRLANNLNFGDAARAAAEGTEFGNTKNFNTYTTSLYTSTVAEIINRQFDGQVRVATESFEGGRLPKVTDAPFREFFERELGMAMAEIKDPRRLGSGPGSTTVFTVSYDKHVVPALEKARKWKGEKMDFTDAIEKADMGEVEVGVLDDSKMMDFVEEMTKAIFGEESVEKAALDFAHNWPALEATNSAPWQRSLNDFKDHPSEGFELDLDYVDDPGIMLLPDGDLKVGRKWFDEAALSDDRKRVTYEAIAIPAGMYVAHLPAEEVPAPETGKTVGQMVQRAYGALWCDPGTFMQDPTLMLWMPATVNAAVVLGLPLPFEV